MNLSSLSSARLGAALAAGAIALGLVVDFAGATAASRWLYGAALILDIDRDLGTLRAAAAIVGVAAVCRAGAKGDLETRILTKPESGDIGQLQDSVNDLLDITDAFVREASGVMSHVGRGQYFRKVLVRGLPGNFRASAETINRTTAAMDGKVREFKAVVDTFETSVAGVVQTVARRGRGDCGPRRRRWRVPPPRRA